MAKQEGDQATQGRNKKLFIYKTKQAGFRKSKTGPGTINIQDETGWIQKIKYGTRKYSYTRRNRLDSENQRRDQELFIYKTKQAGFRKSKTGPGTINIQDEAGRIQKIKHETRN